MSLERFLAAQEGSYATALAELRAGAKSSHWMWWIFPQLRGLGHSPRAQEYGLADADEARAYAAHPVLGPRLAECAEAMLLHQGTPPEAILGATDALKLRSCATLFAEVDGGAPGAALGQVLSAFYAAPCSRTLAMLTE